MGIASSKDRQHRRSVTTPVKVSPRRFQVGLHAGPYKEACGGGDAQWHTVDLRPWPAPPHSLGVETVSLKCVFGIEIIYQRRNRPVNTHKYRPFWP